MGYKTYSEQMKERYIIKIREMLLTLPHFCEDYFRAMENNTSERTRIGYARDLKCFFDFLITEIDEFKDIKSLSAFTIEHLGMVSTLHIEKFLHHVSFYVNQDSDMTRKNTHQGKARKLSSLRSLFKYFQKNKYIITNPAAVVDAPKIHQKEIIRLEANEVADLLDETESGEKLTKEQKKYHPILYKRDLALISLLLGTGIRVSECVGLDLRDINFNDNSIRVIRKGGNQSILYIPDEVVELIQDYLSVRDTMGCKEEDENALFISLKKKRLSVRSVEDIVKKYSKTVTTLKNITPHKLRSTFGTNLYRETGDIYLVAEVLGHRDVNTTRKHYAALDEEQKRLASRTIKLRRD